MQKKYGVKLELPNGEIFRFGTEKLFISETVGGQTKEVPYIPYIINIDPLTSELNLEGKPSIPNVSISVWDAYGDLKTELNKINFEATVVTLYSIDGDSTDKFIGFVADITYEDGSVKFSIQMDEDRDTDEVFEPFTAQTFQKTIVRKAKDVNVTGSYKSYPDTPWDIDSVTLAKTYLIATHTSGASELSIKTSDRLLAGSHEGTIATYDTYGGPNSNPNYGRKRYESIKASNPSNTPTIGIEFVSGTDDKIIRHSGQWSTDEGFDVSNGNIYIEVQDSEQNDGIYAVTNINQTNTTRDTLVLDNEEFPLAASNDGDGSGIKGVKVTPFVREDILDTTGGTLLVGGSLKRRFQDDIIISEYEKINYSAVGSGGAEATIILNSNTSVSHPFGSVVTEEGNFDQIVVRANGFVPKFLDDPELAVCFIYAGIKRSKNRLYHRLELSSSDDVMEIQGYDREADEATTEIYLRFKVHNRSLDSSHSFTVDNKNSKIELQEQLVTTDEPLVQGSVVKLMEYRWTVNYIDFIIENLSTSLSNEDGFDAGAFDNRLKGERFDVMNSLTNLEKTLVSSNDYDNEVNQEIGEVHKELLNNATGQFAVATKSEIIIPTNETYHVERAYFYTPDIIWEEVDDNSGDANLSPTFEKQIQQDEVYSNYMFYSNLRLNKASQADNDLGKAEARDFFESRKYRILKDPVPQGAKDLGKNFPIVYGRVYRVPMIHAISTKTMKESQKTSGDDVYIYASHPTNVRSPLDIDIELIDPDGQQGELDSKERSEEDFGIETLPVVDKHRVQSPFPKQVFSHKERTYDDEIVTSIPFYNPYHKIDTFETIFGKRLQGVKLRGAEYDPEIGSADARYPIRNGVGNSTLYASFSGWPSGGGFFADADSVIQHPLDIVEHFAKFYGNFTEEDFNNFFDEDNLQEIKSLTREYEASVFLNEEIGFSEFMHNLVRQFALNWYIKDGTIFFDDVTINFVDYSKPISENLNILNKVSAENFGLKKVYDKIIYNYDKNYVDSNNSNNFKEQIILDKRNNRFCARAAKAVSNKEAFTMDANYVRSSGVANKVARKFAEIMCQQKIQYDCHVKYTDGIRYSPGDWVPLTYPPLDLDNEPVLITKVKEGLDVQDITAVRFVDYEEYGVT